MLDAIRGLIAWTPLGLPAFLFVITLVVFFHELGHFLVARWFGVKVDVFSVGFGKEIFGWNDKRGTRWKVSWIPVGGYVKFDGDADASSRPDVAAAAQMSAAERDGVLALKPLGQRALVAASGPFANFILAIVLLTGLFLYSGHTVIAPVIGEVTKGSPAAAAGITSGDRVTRIDGTQITDFQQLPEIISVAGGAPLAIGIYRGNQDLRYSGQCHQPDGDRGSSERSRRRDPPGLWSGGRLCRGLLRNLEHPENHPPGDWPDDHRPWQRGPAARPGRDHANDPSSGGFRLSAAAQSGGYTFCKHRVGQSFSHSAPRRGASSVLWMRSCFGASAG